MPLPDGGRPAAGRQAAAEDDPTAAADAKEEDVEGGCGAGRPMRATRHTAPELRLPRGRRRRRGDERGDVYGLAATLRDICAQAAAAAPCCEARTGCDAGPPAAAEAAAATASGGGAEADAAAAAILPAGRGRSAAARRRRLAAALARGWAADPAARPAAAALLDALEPAGGAEYADGCGAGACRVV